MPPKNKDNERRRALKRGEILALQPDAIRRDDRGAFFFLFGASVARNERAGESESLAVVNIRGPLDQFSDCWGDNYESIVDRVTEAMTGEDRAREIKRRRHEAYWTGEVEEIDESPIERTPPHCVVLRMSSPGGVVAGLWECVRKLQSLSETHGIPLVAYVDELAASAAYAIACACDDIYLPESGVVGSIGVISHMFSIARANDDDGIDVEVIASGDEKTDGNECLPISDDAKSRERARVMKLARQFFRIVSGARSLSPAKVEALQAGIKLGDDGVKAGLADAVMGWDAFLSEISLAYDGTTVKDSVAQRGTLARGKNMTALLALIAQTKKDIATASGARRRALQDKLARLSASLSDLQAYKKTTKKTEETKEESESDPEESEDDEKDEDAESDDDDKDAESAGDDEDAESDDDDKDAESAGDDEDAESDDKDDEAMLASISDPKKRGRLAARLGEAKAGREALSIARKLRAEREAEKSHAAIDKKLAGHYITKREASWLKKQPKATVSSFLAMRKYPILRTDDTQEIPADTGRPGARSGISTAELDALKRAHLATGSSIPLAKFIEDYEQGKFKPNGVKIEGDGR